MVTVTRRLRSIIFNSNRHRNCVTITVIIIGCDVLNIDVDICGGWFILGYRRPLAHTVWYGNDVLWGRCGVGGGIALQTRRSGGPASGHGLLLAVSPPVSRERGIFGISSRELGLTVTLPSVAIHARTRPSLRLLSSVSRFSGCRVGVDPLSGPVHPSRWTDSDVVGSRHSQERSGTTDAHLSHIDGVCVFETGRRRDGDGSHYSIDLLPTVNALHNYQQGVASYLSQWVNSADGVDDISG